MFCRLQAIVSLIVLSKVSPIILFHLCIFLIYMLTETKIAIQNKNQAFLSGRSQYIVVIEDNWWSQRFFKPLRKIYLLFTYLCQD